MVSLVRDVPGVRTWWGIRPLYAPDENERGGRSVSRDFFLLNHALDGVDNMASIVGGKLTTYRQKRRRRDVTSEGERSGRQWEKDHELIEGTVDDRGDQVMLTSDRATKARTANAPKSMSPTSSDTMTRFSTSEATPQSSSPRSCATWRPSSLRAR